jgi:hypothetical protein
VNNFEFLQVVHAQATEPTSCKTLTLYRPPTETELAALPPLPLVEREVRYTLAIRLGRAHDGVHDFSTAPNPKGVDETVCRKWKFVNGLFVNDETFGWPSLPPRHLARDLLVYDPNWPWNRLLLTEHSQLAFLKLLSAPGVEEQPLGYREVIAVKLAQMVSDAWWRKGYLSWEPGDFVIPLIALEKDIVDIRSRTRKYYEERFERMRLAQQQRALRREEAERALPPWLAGLLEEK